MGERRQELLDKANKTDDPTARKNLVDWIERKFTEGKTSTNYQREYEAYRAIDNALKHNIKITEEQLEREYGGHVNDSQMKAIIKYYKDKGNVGGMSRTEAENWFEHFTTKKADDRPESFSKYWEYLKTQLEPGKKPKADDYKKWSNEWMNTKGWVDNRFWNDPEDIPRSKAIKKGKLEKFQEGAKLPNNAFELDTDLSI